MKSDVQGFCDYLKSKDIWCFINYCTCGGYASSMNNRNPDHPHSPWCAQYDEWEKHWEEYKQYARTKNEANRT